MIWLAEDNPADVYLVQTSLNRHGINDAVMIAHDGEEASRYIDDVDHGAPRPDIALVDLNLPRYTGSEVVKAIRSSERCRSIPVIIISSSASLEDREEMRSLGISGYFRKPSDFDEFMRLGELVRSVLQSESHHQAR